MKKSVFYFGIFVAIALYFPQPVFPTEPPGSEKTVKIFETVSKDLAFEKGCLSCHDGIEDISPLMTKAGAGCTTCHLGNPLAVTKDEAHKGMFANPGEHDAKRMLLNMITTSLYLGLPLLWSGMMAWAGMKVGRSIDSATNPVRAPAQDAGNQGGSIGKAVVTRGAKR